MESGAADRAKAGLAWFGERRWAWPLPALSAMALGLLLSDRAWQVVMLTGRSGRASPSVPAHMLLTVAAVCSLAFWLLGSPLARDYLQMAWHRGARVSAGDAGCAVILLQALALLSLYAFTALLWARYVL